MGPHKDSFAGKIRQAAQELGAGGKTFTVKEVSHHAGLQTGKEEKAAANTLRDFIKAGEAQRVSAGVFLYLGRKRLNLPLKDQMKNLLRIKKVVTVDDLRELGATAEYVEEWLRMLVRRGVIARHDNGRFELIADMPIPENDEKAARLRKLREKKKAEAMKDLEAAKALIGRACQALKEVEP